MSSVIDEHLAGYPGLLESPLCQDLAAYTGRPLELVAARCRSAVFELAWLWEQWKDKPLEFYRFTDLYLFDLTNYQQTLVDGGFYSSWFPSVLRRLNVKTMLDFGGGIGEYTIAAYRQHDPQVDFMEVCGSATFQYAKWRFKRYGVTPQILYENEFIPEKQYDLIVAMDVLEHIAEPQPIIERMARQTEYVIANVDQVPYNTFFPQHISHPDLTPYFEQSQQEPLLWKRRKRSL